MQLKRFSAEVPDVRFKPIGEKNTLLGCKTIDKIFNQKNLKSSHASVYSMNDGLASLHKILKDGTRRKIILLLNEKGSLNYTDLMNMLEIDNTGRVNYHLKILSGLITKREDGQYALTEKGKLASRLLLEFPEDTGQQLYKQWIIASLKAKEMNYLLGGIIFWVLALLSFVILVALNSVNIINMVFPWLFFVNGVLLFIRHFRKSKKTINQEPACITRFK